jgi:Icc-related predicted phosphoesterase
VDLVHSGFHVGSTAVRDFIEEAQPDLVICGHIHESRGKDKIENSVVINCGAAKEGNYALVEISEDTITAENKNHFPRSG